MERRKFIKSTGAAALGCISGMGAFSTDTLESRKPLNKRGAMLDLIKGYSKHGYCPGAFFMHFGEGNLFGEHAIKKHLDYFHACDLDLLKIQYEKKFPYIPEIKRPSDWKNIPLLKKDFYKEQLKVVEGIVKKGKKKALVIATVYSPLSFAGHITNYLHHIGHLNEDPELVKKGLEIITESTLFFVNECVKLGVDGFFQATQGGEANRFIQDNIFEDYIKPFDLIISKEMDDKCECNILHIHAAKGKYKNYNSFVDYPHHIINCGLKLEDKTISTKKLYKIFNRPIMGGFKREGTLVNGSELEIVTKVNQIISTAPEKFVLGATCTVPTSTNWRNLKIAMDAAHKFI